ncbi:hypothetical protein KAS14_03825 [Candidatus Bathyarchaeota archaeon]|nr:hypothetical protein [Candidatus Bathyarchaeota archaeon]
MENETVRIEKHVLSIEQSKDLVIVNIQRIDKQNITDIDIQELQQIFNDMGKWENLMKTGINFLNELGITPITRINKEFYQREFGAEKYNGKVEREKDPSGNEIVKVIFELTEDELHRRENQKMKTSLSEEEIKEQIQNIPKWRMLTKTINHLKTLN